MAEHELATDPERVYRILELRGFASAKRVIEMSTPENLTITPAIQRYMEIEADVLKLLRDQTRGR